MFIGFHEVHLSVCIVHVAEHGHILAGADSDYEPERSVCFVEAVQKNRRAILVLSVCGGPDSAIDDACFEFSFGEWSLENYE